MPVILHQDDFKLWLNPHVHDKGALLPILKPFSYEELETYRVTSKVNSFKFNKSDNI
jgi:putative SOS response-associated peptidase YedK